MAPAERLALLGACGLYCGLCPRHQSTARSRCPGCREGPMRAYCSVFRCVGKRGADTCADCPKVPCGRLRRALKLDKGLDSFVSHRPILDNLALLKTDGLIAFLEEQEERRRLAERLIAHYDAGRSKTLYCTACALLPCRTVERAIAQVEKERSRGTVDPGDLKAAARRMRSLLEAAAADLGTDLRLRRSRR